MSNNDLREWSARLEAGEQDEELLALAARLERAGRNEPSTIPLDYRRQLRRELLTRYPATQAAGRRWRLVQTVAAVGGLALIVILTWFTMSTLQRPSFGGISATAPTPFHIPTAPVMAGALGSYSVNAPDGLEAGRTLELLAYWHVPADLGAAGAFAQLQNEAGQLVAQSDGPLTDMGGEVYEVNLAVPLPAPLPNGSYTLIFGLSDAAGARLPLYDFAQSTVVYEESASPLRVGSVDPAGSEVTETAITPSSTSSGYTLLDDISISSGNIEDMTVEITTRWATPADNEEPPLFALHLLDSEGQLVAQSDGMAVSAGEVILRLNIPANLAPGFHDYVLEGVLYDPASGDRLTFGTPDGEVVSAFRTSFGYGKGSGFYDGEEFNIIIGDLLQDDAIPTEVADDSLAVHEVTPAAGTVLSGTAPLRFTITLDHALSSLPQAILEVRVAALEGENGRGVGLETIDLVSGVGRSTVEIVVNTAELTGPTELGLWLQLKPDAESAPILIEMPEAYRWRYQP